MPVELHVTDLLAAYALGALEKKEAAAVAKHLETCQLCQAELCGYLEVTARLAEAVPQVDPPASLKAGLMERVESKTRARPATKALTFWWQQLLRGGPRLSFTLVLAGIVLVLALVTSNVLLWQEMTQLRAASQPERMQVVRLAGTDFRPQATGLIIISMDGMHGTLVVDDLPALDEEQQYQLWLIRDGQRASGAIFSVGQSGYGAAYISSPEPLDSYSAFGITIEPAGGSPGPTGEKVLGGEL